MTPTIGSGGGSLGVGSWGMTPGVRRAGPGGCWDLGRLRQFPKKNKVGCQGEQGQKWEGLQKTTFRILNQILGSKSKDSNIFKLDLNWSQTKINLNKIFKDFSNLELLKIDLNIQIQTKALNGGLLNWFRKGSQNKI
jgi:hypothetical protein